MTPAYKCECGGTGEVRDSRKKGHTIRRRRRCHKCGTRWNTFETRTEPLRMRAATRREQLIQKIVSTAKELGATS